MTDPDKPEEQLEVDAPEPSRPDPMAALLKRSLTMAESHAEPSILPAVQRRIRKRSRGKFFADGWSTTDARVHHALVAAVMLAIVLLAYYAMGPMGVQ